MLVTIGVDIGQKRDPTAVCVAESDTRTINERPEKHFLIRHLERLPLNTSYPTVARRIGELVSSLREKTGEIPSIFVDATGVGKPIVDLLCEQTEVIRPTAVYFTHGDKRTERIEDGHKQMSLGKALLVSQLQALLQSHRLHLPKTHDAKALAEELLNYEIRVDENANDKYGAFRVGTHDDLVTALGLAVLENKRTFVVKPMLV